MAETLEPRRWRAIVVMVAVVAVIVFGFLGLKVDCRGADIRSWSLQILW